MKNIIIHHVEISHTSPHISGGEKAMIEVIRYLSKFNNIKQIIYTSESGKEVYISLLPKDMKVDYIIIGKQKTERINEYLAYFLRIFQQFKIKTKFEHNSVNIIFSHEEFLPTLLLSRRLKNINKESKWLGFFHMKSPSIWKGFGGEYTNKIRIPSLRIIRYKLEQFIYFKLTKNKINKIITVNPCYNEFLNKIYENHYTLKKFGGENVYTIKKYAGVKITKKDNEKKEYDMVFMGRYHKQKGLFEIPKILKILKKEKNNIRLAIIGGGNDKIEKEFKKIIQDEGLSDNVDFLGFITSEKKFDIIRKSKVFIFPSYYESFGQVALEAMANGLPVVAYDLPIFCVFKKGMIKVPILDNITFSEQILRLLNNKDYYNKISKEALNYASTFSWDKTGEEVYNQIKSLI